jgi:hypothetical protein
MWGIDRTSTRRSTRRAGRIPASGRPAHHRTRRAWWVEQLEGRTLLSNLPVTSTGDSGDSTLRWAIDQANSNKGNDTIDIQVTGTITLKSALPDLSDTTGLTQIRAHEGTSPTVARGSDPGTPEFRIFTVDAGVKAELDGLTIERGYVYGYDTGGGGVRNDGTLTISHSILDNNFASLGGGIFNDGILTVSDSTIRDNHTSAPGSSSGGGIYNAGGDVRVVSCTLVGNTATYGGGIRNQSNGVIVIASSTIRGNTAEFTGGGILNGFDEPWSTASVDVSSSTIEDNTAGSADGGGICNTHTLKVTSSTIDGNSADRGGGIFSYTDLIVDSCTVLGNSTQHGWRGNGGGIYLEAGPATIMSSTIADNSAVSGGGIYSAVGAVTLTNTIVAENLVSGSRQDIQGAIAASSNHNLVGVDSGLSGISNGVGGNIVGTVAARVDPRLGPLQNNGGPTWTMALLPDSPAIDAGDSVNAPAIDQRGAARVGPPDIGAFEFGGESQGVVYNAANDFSLASNPNGVWSFGWTMTLGSPFVRDVETRVRDQIDYWVSNQPGWFNEPLIAQNGTDHPITSLTFTFQPGELGFHPGGSGQYAVIRWTAPNDGTFSIATIFYGLDFAFPTTTDVHVLHDGTSLFDSTIDGFGNSSARPFGTAISVRSGDTIDFAVGYGPDRDFTGDMTGISATLTAVQGPPVETTPPTTTANVSGSVGTAGWYVGPVTVTLSASDPDQAPTSLITTYRLDGGPSTTYDPAHPLVIATNSVHTLTYQSSDPAGNVEATQTQVIRVDQTAPLTTVTGTGQAGSSNWYNGPVTVTLSPRDDVSGVAATQYSLDGGATWIAATSVTLNSGTVYTLSYRSIDIAGNIEAAQTRILNVVDRIPVTALVTSSAPSSVYGQPVTINVQIVPPSGAGTPTGTVIFMDSSGNQVLGESKLSGSSATLTVGSMLVGTHAIRGIYLGDGQFGHLVSDSVAQSVSPAPTLMTFVVEAAPSHRGFILHAKVSPADPAGGTPVGSVTFAADGKCFRRVRAVNGEASGS